MPIYSERSKSKKTHTDAADNLCATFFLACPLLRDQRSHLDTHDEERVRDHVDIHRWHRRAEVEVVPDSDERIRSSRSSAQRPLEGQKRSARCIHNGDMRPRASRANVPQGELHRDDADAVHQGSGGNHDHTYGAGDFKRWSRLPGKRRGRIQQKLTAESAAYSTQHFGNDGLDSSLRLNQGNGLDSLRLNQRVAGCRLKLR